MTARYSKYLPGFVFITDFLLFNIALYFANFIVYGASINQSNSKIFFLLVNFCWVFTSIITKNYKVSRPLVLKDSVNRFLIAITYHLVFVLGAIYFFRLYEISRLEVFFSYSFFLIFILTDRSVLFFFLDYIRKRGYNHRQIAILGDKEISKKLIESFNLHPEYGYDISTVLYDEDLTNIAKQDLFDQLLNKNPHEVFVCYKQLNDTLLENIVDFGKENGIKIKLVTDITLANDAELIKYDNIPVIHVNGYPDIELKIRILKRCFDVGFSSAVMLTGLPVFVLLYVVTRLSSKGPAFYKQERVGKGEKPFYIYKFRSMHLNSERFGPQLSAGDHDPRITKWGRVIRKTRLDELPQFWNVLKGDMSVVGPRPERQYFIEQIIERKPTYKKLLTLKPGITSIGQVQYGYADNVDQMCDRVNYDLFYLKNMSFNQDINIIMKTVKVMVQRKGK